MVTPRRQSSSWPVNLRGAPALIKPLNHDGQEVYNTGSGNPDILCSGLPSCYNLSLVWEQVMSVDSELLTANDNQTLPTVSYSYDPPPPPLLWTPTPAAHPFNPTLPLNGSQVTAILCLPWSLCKRRGGHSNILTSHRMTGQSEIQGLFGLGEGRVGIWTTQNQRC